MELSDRLSAVAAMVTKGNCVCDVGCDHGYIPIYLVLNHISPKVIAMDVKMGPLQRAASHIKAYGMTEYIETRLSNGVEKLKIGEVQTVICAGMGGRLMSTILTEGKAVIDTLEELILQPQSELEYFRSFLEEQGYVIIKEDMVQEEGKFYPMMKVVPKGRETGVSFVPKHLAQKYGGLLLEERHPVLKEFLEYQTKKQTEILLRLSDSLDAERMKKRRSEIELELCHLAQALAYYEKRD